MKGEGVEGSTRNRRLTNKEPQKSEVRRIDEGGRCGRINTQPQIDEQGTAEVGSAED